MNMAEFEAVKKTFPWHERTIPTKNCALVQVIDNAGNEVPIFTMTRFLTLITTKLAQPASTTQEAASE